MLSYWGYLVSVISVLCIYTFVSLYSLRDLAKYRKNKNVTFVVGICILTLIFVINEQRLMAGTIFYEFIVFVIMYIFYRLYYRSQSLLAVFGASRYVLYLFTSKVLTQSLISLVSGYSILELYELGYSRWILVISILVAAICIQLLYMTVVKNRGFVKLVSHPSQLWFVTGIKFLLSAFILFAFQMSIRIDNLVVAALINIVGVLMVVVFDVVVVSNGIRFVTLLQHEQDNLILQKLYETQVSNYKSYELFTQQFQTFRKELNTNFPAIIGMIRRQEGEQAIRILDDIAVQMGDNSVVKRNYTNFPFLDAVLLSFSNICHEKDIDFDVLVYWEKGIYIDDLKIVRVFTDIFDMVIDKVESQAKEKRLIFMRSNPHKHWLEVVIKFPIIDLEEEETLDVLMNMMESFGGLMDYRIHKRHSVITLHFPKIDSMDDNFQ